MNKERILPIKYEGYEGYFISSHGRILSNKVKGSTKGSKTEDLKEVKPRIINTGYRVAQFWVKGKKEKHLLHRLVATHFIKNPKNYPIVLHRDNDIANNYASNLKWGTLKMNQQQCIKDGRKTITGNSLKLIFITGEEIKFKTQKEASTYLGIRPSKFSKIILGKLKPLIGITIKLIKQ